MLFSQINIVRRPDGFQLLEVAAQLLLAVQTQRHDQGVDDAHGRGQRVHEGGHIGACGKAHVAHVMQGRHGAVGDDHYRFHDHDKLAHYANAATDIEFLMPFGFKEVEGIHSRTNFDLSQHEKFSGKSIKYFDPELNESYTPYVIETSIGVDRMFLSIMSAAYTEETLENGETRVVLKLPAALAPVKLAVMPLVKKDGLPEKAREIMNDLKFHFHCQYDEKDSIGKRYRRQDAIGTPYCITVDHQTLEDNCVTLRNRDTMQQERVAISELNNIIADKVSITSLLKTLQ